MKDLRHSAWLGAGRLFGWAAADKPARHGQPPLHRRVPWQERARVWTPVVALLALVALFSAGSPLFLSVANVQILADAAAIPLILATGMTFVILMGSIDLSIEGVVAASSCLVALLIKNDRTSLDLGIIGIVITLAAGALFGAVNGLVTTKLRVSSFMTTLGTWSIGLGLASMLYGSRAVIIQDMTFRQLVLTRWGGFTIETYLAVLVVLLGLFLQRHTRLGRYAYAIGGNEEVARTAGVPVDRYKILVFSFAAAMSALAGVMTTARLGVGDVAGGSGDLFATITAVVVGGTLLTGSRGGVLQSVIGVLIVTVLTNGMIHVGVDPLIQQGVQGFLIVLAVAVTTWPLKERLRVVK